jgi:hypothetical protein
MLFPLACSSPLITKALPGIWPVHENGQPLTTLSLQYHRLSSTISFRLQGSYCTCLLPARRGSMTCWFKRLSMKRFCLVVSFLYTTGPPLSNRGSDSLTWLPEPEFLNPFQEPKNRFQGTNSAMLCSLAARTGIFKKSMGARNRGGKGLLYRPARLHRLAEFIPWNQFRGPINI